METPSSASGPTVKPTQSFRKGDRLACKSTGEEFEVLSVSKAGYVCKGRAGIMPKEAAERILTAAEKEQLAKESAED